MGYGLSVIGGPREPEEVRREASARERCWRCERRGKEVGRWALWEALMAGRGRGISHHEGHGGKRRKTTTEDTTQCAIGLASE